MAIRLVVTITATRGKGSELALLERWVDQAALDAHARLTSTRPPLLPELRAGSPEREDYEYNRTR